MVCQMNLLSASAFSGEGSTSSAELVTLKNRNGLVAQFTNYGARWVSMWTPDRDGCMGDKSFYWLPMMPMENLSAIICTVEWPLFTIVSGNPACLSLLPERKLLNLQPVPQTGKKAIRETSK